MTKEEAIEIIRDTYHTDTELEALKVLIPELKESKESEDERIRKFLLRLANRCDENSIDFLGDIKKKDVIAWLEKQKEQKPVVIKPHKGDDTNPYDMGVPEAQDYAIKRGFGIPFNDGEVYVDERHIIQTIGNILKWADEHPKEQKPADEQFPPLEGLDAIKAKYYDDGFKNGFDEGVESVKQAEWGEEDKRALNNAIVALSMYANGEIPYLLPSQLLEDVERLKSLQPQAKQEWSEEDEHRCKDAIYFLETAKKHYADTSEIELTIEWLKLLRPQSKDEIHKGGIS